MKMKAIPIGLLALSMLGGCAANAPHCGGGAHAAVMDLLYFGSGRPHGPDVTEQEWTGFVHDEIAPRFPQGFSLLEAQGQWRNADGSTAHEQTHVLQLVHPADARSEQAVAEIADRYKTQFAQEAVLRLRAAACMSL